MNKTHVHPQCIKQVNVEHLVLVCTYEGTYGPQPAQAPVLSPCPVLSLAPHSILGHVGPS